MLPPDHQLMIPFFSNTDSTCASRGADACVPGAVAGSAAGSFIAADAAAGTAKRTELSGQGMCGRGERGKGAQACLRSARARAPRRWEELRMRGHPGGGGRRIARVRGHPGGGRRRIAQHTSRNAPPPTSPPPCKAKWSAAARRRHAHAFRLRQRASPRTARTRPGKRLRPRRGARRCRVHPRAWTLPKLVAAGVLARGTCTVVNSKKMAQMATRPPQHASGQGRLRARQPDA